MPADLYTAIERFQGDVIRREQRTASALTDYYARVYRTIDRQIARLDASIVDAQAQGVDISPAWFFQQDRLVELQRQVAVELVQFGRYADDVTKKGLADVIRLADDHAGRVFRQMGVHGTWADLNEGAIQSLIGAATGSGSPLGALFASLGPATQGHITTVIVNGLALGNNPRDVARSLRNVADIPLVRAQTIARTEQLRAYREGSRAAYNRNKDLVDGWIWFSARDRRTCPACWGMHGSHHKLGEPMPAHPNCRCTMIPDVIGATLRIRPGEEDFSFLPPDDQRAILGPGQFDAYKAGKIRLEDMVHVRTNAQWGDTVQVASKDQALRNAAARTITPPTPPRPVQPITRPSTATLDLQAQAEAARARLNAIEQERQAAKIAAQAKYDRLFADWRAANRAAWEPRPPGMTIAEKDAQFKDLARHQAILDRQKKVMAGIDDKYLAKMRESLVVQKPIKVTVLPGYKVPVAAQKRWQRGADWFARFTERQPELNGQPLDEVLFDFATGQYAKRSYQSGLSVYMARSGPGSKEGTVVHELGHWLEAAHPGVRQAVRDFLAKRTAGETPVQLSQVLGGGYRPGEMTLLDKFIHPYMGKVYSGATEITSMGLQAFYESPLNLATRDPEYFDFIYRVARGGT